MKTRITLGTRPWPFGSSSGGFIIAPAVCSTAARWRPAAARIPAGAHRSCGAGRPQATKIREELVGSPPAIIGLRQVPAAPALDPDTDERKRDQHHFRHQLEQFSK